MLLQVFEGLWFVGCRFWCIDVNIVILDYNVLIMNCSGLIEDEVFCIQVQILDDNCDEFGIVEFKMNDYW